MRDSSLEAHDSVKPKKESHYAIIERAVRKAKKDYINGVTGLQMSMYCDLSYHAIMKRVSEMEKLKRIKVVGRAAQIKNRPLLWDLCN
jgi:hypothetical protein